MGKLVHRHGDLRICGATTVVVGQSTVTVDGKLWAVLGDLNNHGAGALINTTGSSVTINGKPVIVHGPDNANPDNLCPPVGPPHCNPMTSSGIFSVTCYSDGARNPDSMIIRSYDGKNIIDSNRNFVWNA